MNTYYAKPDQTYSEHVEAVYAAWRETALAKDKLIDRLAQLYGFNKERFLQGSLLSVALHDLGKMIKPFQEMMLARREGKVFNLKRNYRHELASFVFALYAWKVLNRSQSLCSIPIEALVIAGHHKELNTDLSSFNREEGSSPEFFNDGLKYALSLAADMFSRQGWQMPPIKEGLEKINPHQELSRLVYSVLHVLLKQENQEKVRALYILMKGILHYADWHASGGANINYAIAKSRSMLLKDMAERCQKKGINFKGLRPFQDAMGNASGHLLAIAPTGSGKTEGSLLWALKNSEEMGGAKVIYLLPTMNTATSIWQRLSDIFGEENVGLTHSTANLLLSDLASGDEEEEWENRRNWLFDQAFIRPVTVGTVDQLLTAGFNAGRWVLKEINAANAVIVLDEIHAYDGWTLGLVISSIRHFAKVGSRFLLMSATMPDNLIKLFNRELEIPAPIREETLLNARRSRYKVLDMDIEDASDTIKEAVREGRKVLVVVNTVEKCRKLAVIYAELKPVCYHSMFILKHRKKIEEKIEDSRFVIATQVVEVSLDIDFDWLFTECAPPDAIFQRAGRVNRYRHKDRDSRVYIFKHSDQAAKVYNPINNSELLNSAFVTFRKYEGYLTEQDLLNILEMVYRNYRIEDTEAFKDAVKVYHQVQKQSLAILDNRMEEDKQQVTRQSKYETVSVIPLCFQDDVILLKPKERRWYEIKVPLWYFKKHGRNYSGIYFCDLDYDPHLGAGLKPTDHTGACIF